MPRTYKPNSTVQVGEWFCQLCGRPGTAGVRHGVAERKICEHSEPKWMVKATGTTIAPPDENWSLRYPENVGKMPRRSSRRVRP